MRRYWEAKMPRSRRNNLIAAIDNGTEFVRCVIAEKTETGLDIIGVGKARSTGVKHGVVININETVNAIRSAVEAAELMAGREVDHAYCSISGNHVRGRNLSGIVSVRGNEVKEEDVHRVVKQARAIRMEPSRECIHVLPIEFQVDDIYGLPNPVGIAGVRLEARVHMVTAAKSAIDNITTCCSREGIGVAGVIFSALAGSETILHPDEKELGVLYVDIGAGTADYAVWFNGGVIQTGVVSSGGKMITNDIATAMCTPRAEAEELKLKYGCALTSMVSPDEMIEVPAVGGRKAERKSRMLMVGVIEPVLEEIFVRIGEQVRAAGHEQYVGSGMVLSGGCSNMKGVTELAEQILGIPVRVGEMLLPQLGVRGVSNELNDPTYAVALGMVLMAARQERIEKSQRASSDDTFWEKVKNWFKEAFIS